MNIQHYEALAMVDDDEAFWLDRVARPNGNSIDTTIRNYRQSEMGLRLRGQFDLADWCRHAADALEAYGPLALECCVPSHAVWVEP